MTFGQKLRTMRENAGMSRRELEDRSGISQRTIQYLEEDGPKDPRRGTLEALAQVLGRELLEAAFPDLVVLSTRSRKSPTRRESSLPDWAIGFPAPEPLAVMAGARS